jgi:hypothetical protein
MLIRIHVRSDVSFGSFSEVRTRDRDVRTTFRSRHRQAARLGPIRAARSGYLIARARGLAGGVCCTQRVGSRIEMADYFGASGPTNLRPLGPVPLTWITVGSRIST